MNIFLKIATAFGSGSSSAKANKKWTGEVIEAYAGVSAGVEINRKCSLLSDAETNSLEKDFNQLGQALEGKINQEFLTMVRETSKKMAEDTPYNKCNKEAREAVTEAQAVVAYWLRELGMAKES